MFLCQKTFNTSKKLCFYKLLWEKIPEGGGYIFLFYTINHITRGDISKMSPWIRVWTLYSPPHFLRTGEENFFGHFLRLKTELYDKNRYYSVLELIPFDSV